MLVFMRHQESTLDAMQAISMGGKCKYSNCSGANQPCLGRRHSLDQVDLQPSMLFTNAIVGPAHEYELSMAVLHLCQVVQVQGCANACCVGVSSE
jgi:hypothetical protein